LKLFVLMEKDGSFPMSLSMYDLDLWLKSYVDLKNSDTLWACCEPLILQ
jgi:hypothetical protein